MSSADRDGPTPGSLDGGPGALDRPASAGRKLLLAALACVYLALLVAPVAILVQEHAIQREISEYFAGEDRGSLFRTEVEYLAALNVLYRAAAGDPSADRRAVQRTVDLLYSRNEVLKSSAITQTFGDLPAHRVLVETMDRAIRRADAVLAGESGPRISTAGLETLIEAITALDEPLRVLLRDALLQASRSRDALRERADDQAALRQMATGALIVASVFFIGALVWNVHRLRGVGSRLRRLASTVQQSEARLRLIADNLPMLIGYVEPDGRVLFVNRTAEEWSGRAAEQIGGGIAVLLGPETRDAVAPHVAEAAAGRVGRFEGRLAFPDGARRIVEAAFIPDFGPGRRVRGFFVVMIDITARKESDAQLRQALKMEAVGRLTGGVAHDFNNLLSVVVGNLDLVEAELTGRPKELLLIRRALAAAERGAALTQRLLAFSRRQMLSPRLTDVSRLVVEVADTLLPALGETIDIVTLPARQPCFADVDANQLEAAILNLAVNARDAMPGGGGLTIATSVIALDADDAAQLSEVAAGDYVAITVSDTGEGMSPDVARQAFEPFFTTKDVGKGSGLGLSMVFGFVKQSGGHVEIESELGSGTTVRLYLPRAARAAAAGTERTDPVPSQPGEGRLILVVEDNRDLLAFSTAALNRLGYRTVQAENGAAALDLLARTPDVELLFTDVVLPGMNGVALAEEARRRHPSLEVLFTSGFVAGDAGANVSLPAGAELLVKPYRIAELGRRLDKAFGSGG